MAKICAQISEVFSASSDLWVLPSPRDSRWVNRLDWYLNGQISKAMARVPARPSAELVKVALDAGIAVEPSHMMGPEAPLMVISKDLLPASSCLVLGDSQDAKKWLSEVLKQAQAVGAQSVRIFLPSTLEPNKAAQFLEKQAPKIDVQLVTEDLT